jgi:hypothetical protein
VLGLRYPLDILGLHDFAGHAINVILVQAGAAPLHERNPEHSRESIATTENMAGTRGEIDRIVRALRERDEPEPPAPANHVAVSGLVARETPQDNPVFGLHAWLPYREAVR